MPVKAGQEALVSYGPAYWPQHERLYGKLKAKLKSKLKAKKLERARKTGLPELSKKGRRAAKAEAAARFALAYASTCSEQLFSSPSIAQLPRTMADVRQSPHREQWEQAIRAELHSWDKMGVFKVVDAVPPGERLHDAKGVFKIKLDADGHPSKFKFRIVARGFTQIYGQDFFSSYAPTMDGDSLRTLCAFATALDLEIGCADVETAYLHANLDKPIYIVAPEFFHDFKPGTILQLHKAVYGLKQSARLWNLHLTQQLQSIGFNPLSNSDPCIFVYTHGARALIIGVFVDDMVYVYDKRDEAVMNRLKQELGQLVTLKDLGPATSVLGIRIHRDRKHGVLQLCQPNYTAELAAQYGFTSNNCKAADTPESASTDYSAVDDSSLKAHSKQIAGEPITYAILPRVIGQLSYLATNTRPDIARAVNRAAQDQADPTEGTLARVRHILHYLAHHFNLPLIYSAKGKQSLCLHAFSDASFAPDSDRKSHTGVVAKLCGGAISWTSKRQPTVAHSGSEAENIAAGEGERELRAIRNFLTALTLQLTEPSPLYVDSTVAQAMAQGEGSHKRRRHIDIKHHAIREQIKNKVITVEWVRTADQQADMLTKPLPRKDFQRLRALVMGHELSSLSA